MSHTPNGKIAECVRGHCARGWHGDAATNAAHAMDGCLAPDDRPGLGNALGEEFPRHTDAQERQFT